MSFDVRIQTEDFSMEREVAALRAGDARVGAVCVFVGTVRDRNDGSGVASMTLEHYPGMTEKALEDIEAEAQRRWPIEASLIVHRYGRMEAGDRIVLVAVGSPHREAAFEACEFLVDWLKTKAPFWKLEETPAGDKWVGAHEGDDKAAARWEKK